jgi:peroxiredoxin
MKNFLFGALPLALVSIFALNVFTGELPIGADIPNPDLKMKDIKGREISLKEVKQKNGLLVMFSCNTCPVVRGYQSRTKEICKYALDNNIGVILLNSNERLRNDGDSFSDMKQYAQEQEYAWYYAVDEKSKMANAFDANRTPECFLFNKDGKLSYHGAIDDNPRNSANVKRHHLKEAIDEMNAGKDVTVKITRSVGCGIKRD